MVPVLLWGQNISRIDSLKTSLLNARGIDRFNLLNDLGFEYRLSYPDSTIYYGELAYEIGRELGLEKGMSKPLSFIGVAMSYKCDYEASFDYQRHAISLARDEVDYAQLGFEYTNVRRLFFDQGDMARAYHNFIEAETIFTATGAISGLSYVARSLASLYKSQNDLDKAL